MKRRRPDALEVEAFVLMIIVAAMLSLTAIGYLETLWAWIS